MPIIRITNLSASTISLGSSLGSLKTRNTKTLDVPASEMERLSDSITELQANGLITWSIDTNSEGIEFYPSEVSATKTQGRMDIYVDATKGSDTSPGTNGNPLATLIEAERRIPDFVVHPVVIHVAPHTGDGYALPTFRARVMRASIDVAADSGGTRNDGLNEIYPETAALAGSNHVTINTPPGLGVDTFRGKAVEVLSGQMKGFRRTIQSNTDNSITFGWCLPDLSSSGMQFQPGDTFRIIEPLTVINPGYGHNTTQFYEAAYLTRGQGSKDYYFSRTNQYCAEDTPAVNFVGLIFQEPSPDGVVYLLNEASVRFFGCELGNKSVAITGGSITSGVDGYHFFGDGLFESEVAKVGQRVTGVSVHAWAGWGLMGGNTLRLNHTHTYLGCPVLPSLFLSGGNVVISGCSIWEKGIYAAGRGTTGGPGTVYLAGKLALPDIQQIIRSEDVTRPAVWLVGATVTSTSETRIEAPGGIGVQADNGAFMDISYTTRIEADKGIVSRTGSRVYVTEGVLSITATGNEIEVGNTPTVGTLAANLANKGDYIAELDGSAVQRAQ